jgi:hypothetical protein
MFYDNHNSNFIRSSIYLETNDQVKFKKYILSLLLFDIFVCEMASSSRSHYVLVLCCIIITVHCQLDADQLEENQADNSEPNQFDNNVAEEEMLYEDYLAEMNQVDSETEKEQISNDHQRELASEPNQVSADGEEDLQALLACKFTCPKGKSPQWNPSFQPATNGCGSQGQFDGWVLKKCSYIIECCNQHDICYGTYGVSRRWCDSEFASCNKRTPANMRFWDRSGCKTKGGLMAAAVKIAGCKFFKGSQSKATICV